MSPQTPSDVARAFDLAMDAMVDDGMGGFVQRRAVRRQRMFERAGLEPIHRPATPADVLVEYATILREKVRAEGLPLKSTPMGRLRAVEAAMGRLGVELTDDVRARILVWDEAITHPVGAYREVMETCLTT